MIEKKVFEKVDLTCVFQQETDRKGTDSPVSGAESTVVRHGIFSATEGGGYLFQETLAKRKAVRNAKLYQGSQVSVVRRKDGFYYPLLKSFRPEDIADKSAYAFRIYCEIQDALNNVL